MQDDSSQPGRTRAFRLPVILPAEEMKALEDFRFEHRMPSRAATVRELMRRGLQAVEAGQKRPSGGRLGVLSAARDV
jgi:hypothetical protein